MAKTIRTGYLLPAAGGAATVHTAAGRLLSVLLSHAQAGVQTVTFYNAAAATPGTEILILNVAPTQCPYFLQFPRDAGIPFDTSLHIVPGNCDTLIWTVDYG